MTPQAPNRLIVIDLLRTFALLGMISFHFTYDLEMFGWLYPGTASSGWFWYHARLTAGAFIFLAGVSLYLAHSAGIRWQAFARRQAKIIAAAVLISVATYFAMPEAWIFYGILHSIAVSSMVGLAFLRLPMLLNAALTAAVFALPYFYANAMLDGPFVWLGLSGRVPITADYQPFFPWFAPMLAGIACGQAIRRFGLPQLLHPQGTPLLRALAWPSKHSLKIYLIHQPVLIALIYAFTWTYWRI